MAFNFMGNVKTLTSSVTSLKKELSGVYDVLKKIKGLGPSAFGDVNAVLSKSGQFGNGQGTPVFGKTTVNGATKFSSQTPMAAAKPGSNAQQSQYEKTATAIHTQYLDLGIRQAKFSIAAGAAGVVTSAVSGAASMLPDVGDVAKRAGGFYSASAMFGGTNRTQNQLSTMAAMKGGITGPLGTMEAFGTFTNYSYMPGSSNMKMGLEQTSAAAKALNMDNATAANAIGALSTGNMGAQLYQYGIRQYDDKGNLRTPGAIAKDVMQRVFYPGKDVTKIGAEQFAKDSMGMNLDYQLSTMGITGETAQLIKASMGNIASGKSGELKDFKTSDNPLNPFYKINSSEESLTQKSEKGLLKGAETAAEALVKLNKALEHTPELILQMKGALQTFNGTKSGGSLLSTVKDVVSKGAHVFAGWKTLKYLKNLKAGAVGGAEATVAGTTAAEAAGATTAAAAAETAAAAEAATVAGTSAAAAAGTTAAIALPAALLIGGQYAINKKGQENLSDLERVVYQQQHGGRNPDGTYSDMSGGPNASMSAAPKESWWQKTTNWLKNNTLSGVYGSQTGGGPTDGFSSNFSSNAPSVNSFTFSSGAQPMANGPLAASMSSTSISKVIGAGFGAKDSSMTMAGALNYHTGQDTPMPVGTPVYARFAGKVVERNLSRDLGIAVEIDHGDGYSSIYGHLNLKSVRSGQEVKVGDLIGKSGSTGRVRGPHLHFELRKGKVPTDPKGYDPFVPNDKSDGKKGTASSAAGASVGPANVSAGIKASGKELHAWLMSQGLSSNGATGVLGNLIQESGLKTGSIGDNGTSFGIAQWHQGRGDNLKKFAASMGLEYTDLEAQKMFLWKEMQSYPGMVKALKNPNIGIVDAAALFMRKFERPKDQTDAAAAKRASLGIGAVQGGPKDGFNTNVPTATLGTDMESRNPGVATALQGGTNNIYVTLQIQQANQQEAEAFAKTLKKYLEKDNKLQKIGSN